MENTLLQFKQIPAFKDNYLWAIAQNQQAWIVDPGDAAPIIAYLEESGCHLKGILITHHHQDHIGGVSQLLAWAQEAGQGTVKCIGPVHTQITFLNQVIQDQDEVELFPEVVVKVLAVPGHTLSHVAYFLKESHVVDIPRLYCGDTLFATGCGRLFEGSAYQMYASLEKFAQLPDTTLICCAHEYTLSNIRFALFLEPENTDLSTWATQAAQLRSQDLPTVPTTLALEKKVNPFMRCAQPQLWANVQKHAENPIDTASEVLAVMRKMKDSFS